MVVFACNSCGLSLKKNQVDKHVFQCRCSTVSCMDCQKDFGLKEYGAHIKCISELEKYAGTGWKAPANFNKGEKKQEAWVDTVNATLKKAGDNLSPQCRSLLQAISKHDNVPRKKPKFMNFIRNISKHRFDEKTIENVWTLIEAQWKSQIPPPPANANDVDKSKESGKENSEKQDDNETETNENGNDEHSNSESKKLSKREKKEARKQKQHKEEKKTKRKHNTEEETECSNVSTGPESLENGNEKQSKKERKKRKRIESETENGTENKKAKGNNEEDEDNNAMIEEQENEEVSNQEFRWGVVIRQVLLKQPDHEISMKKLRKKVFAEYYGTVGDSKGNKSQEELISKLNKKLKKQQFKVVKDNVKLMN